MSCPKNNKRTDCMCEGMIACGKYPCSRELQKRNKPTIQKKRRKPKNVIIHIENTNKQLTKRIKEMEGK